MGHALRHDGMVGGLLEEEFWETNNKKSQIKWIYNKYQVAAWSTDAHEPTARHWHVDEQEEIYQRVHYNLSRLVSKSVL